MADKKLQTYKKTVSDDPIYQIWINENEKDSAWKMPKKTETSFSVVVPVYNVSDDLLTECIESVLDQTYPNFELILVDDCSPMESVREVMHRYDNHAKVKTIYRKTNGNISEATNDGIGMASGDFIAFMDCDDVLSTHALSEVAYCLEKHPDTDFIYTDEDKLSEDGSYRRQPFLKPDWSPDTFYSVNYTNHLSVFRTSLVRKTGGLRTEKNGSQDYDFTLRFLLLTDNTRVQHVKKILYYWREAAQSVANDMENKPYVLEAAKTAKEEYFQKKNIDVVMKHLKEDFQFIPVYQFKEEPKVSVVIPSKDNVKMLKKCLTSVFENTSYRNYDVVLVDNGSSEKHRNQIEEVIKNYPITYLYEPMEFNYSKMCNMGVAVATGEYILLLNDDIVVPADAKNWMAIMVGQAMQEHTGACGARLRYPESEAIQHVGIINLPLGPSHAFSMESDEHNLYYGRNRLTYNYLAVTAACLMIKKERYELVGGLDEELRVAYNDVDFCISLFEKGFYNVTRNDVCLYHYESVSRGSDALSERKKLRMEAERKRLYEKHAILKQDDPFYNPGLTKDRLDFSLQIDERQLVRDDYIWREEPEGVASDFRVSIDKVRIDDLVMIKGWTCTDDMELDEEGEWKLLLQFPGNHIIEIPVNKQSRRDVQTVLDSKSANLGFLCVFPVKLLPYHAKIGVLVSYKERKHYSWSETYVRLPKTEENQTEVLEKDYLLDCEKIQMLFGMDRAGFCGGMFDVKGWSFDPATRYNNKRSYQLYVRGKKEYLIRVDRSVRWDVCGIFHDMPNINLCGFSAKAYLPDERDVKVYLIAEEMDTGKKYYDEVPCALH